MSEQTDGPTLWRKHAAELRAFAERFAHTTSRDDLLRLAEQWVRMADREERLKRGQS